MQPQVIYISSAKVISALFFAMYGIVPFALNTLSVYEVHWAIPNLYFSLAGMCCVLTLNFPRKHLKIRQFYSKIYLQKWHYVTLFCLSLTVFILFPWHGDRESLGASFSALMRAAWLVVIFKSIDSSERTRLNLAVATLLLMFIDESRTYFMIMLVVIATRSKYRKTLFVISMLGVILVAATRMGVSSSVTAALLYGIIGESYNATKPVGQVLLIADEPLNVFGHLLHTFLQPFLFPFEFTLNLLLDSKIPSQSSYFADIVAENLGEQLSPMGGWYIVADFIYYGPLGVLLLVFYLKFTWWISNYMLNTSSFPFGAFVFFISIKATPYVYYKFVFYILAVKMLVSLMVRFRVQLLKGHLY